MKLGLMLLSFASLANGQGVERAVLDKISFNGTVIDGLHSIIINMHQAVDLQVNFQFRKELFPTKHVDNLVVTFQTSTESPQFSILNLAPNDQEVVISRKKVEASRYNQSVVVRLYGSYIGIAYFRVHSLEFINSTQKNGASNTRFTFLPFEHIVRVKIVQDEGIWGIIFIVSVSVLIIITYINLGAQLDTENLGKMVKRPKELVVGFLVSVTVMPTVAFFVGKWLLANRTLFQAGSFVFACGPAASASTLWTVMFDADKELSVALQVVSTIGALFIMPVILVLFKVPYSRLVMTLLVLLVSLLFGWRFIGRNERAKKLSAKMFKPLTFFVLIFIIVFSSAIYWHIYRMFDWNITLASAIISLSTYGLSALAAAICGSNYEQVLAISIGSAYKNSGIAFALLLFTFGSPTAYIAYVPCLTQVVTTSLALYLAYVIMRLINYMKRRNQPAPIQATTSEDNDQQDNVESQPTQQAKETRSGSQGNNSTKSEEHNQEFIPMNVTDSVPESEAVLNKTPVSGYTKVPELEKLGSRPEGTPTSGATIV